MDWIFNRMKVKSARLIYDRMLNHGQIDFKDAQFNYAYDKVFNHVKKKVDANDIKSRRERGDAYPGTGPNPRYPPSAQVQTTDKNPNGSKLLITQEDLKNHPRRALRFTLHDSSSTDVFTVYPYPFKFRNTKTDVAIDRLGLFTLQEYNKYIKSLALVSNETSVGKIEHLYFGDNDNEGIAYGRGNTGTILSYIDPKRYGTGIHNVGGEAYKRREIILDTKISNDKDPEGYYPKHKVRDALRHEYAAKDYETYFFDFDQWSESMKKQQKHDGGGDDDKKSDAFEMLCKFLMGPKSLNIFKRVLRMAGTSSITTQFYLFAKKGLEINAMDQSETNFLRVVFAPESFETYTCRKKWDEDMDAEILQDEFKLYSPEIAKLVSTFEKKNRLTGAMTHHGETLTLIEEHPQLRYVKEFNVNVMSIKTDDHRYEVPDNLNFNYKITLSASVASKIHAGITKGITLDKKSAIEDTDYRVRFLIPADGSELRMSLIDANKYNVESNKLKFTQKDAGVKIERLTAADVAGPTVYTVALGHIDTFFYFLQKTENVTIRVGKSDVAPLYLQVTPADGVSLDYYIVPFFENRTMS